MLLGGKSWHDLVLFSAFTPVPFLRPNPFQGAFSRKPHPRSAPPKRHGKAVRSPVSHRLRYSVVREGGELTPPLYPSRNQVNLIPKISKIFAGNKKVRQEDSHRALWIAYSSPSGFFASRTRISGSGEAIYISSVSCCAFCRISMASVAEPHKRLYIAA